MLFSHAAHIVAQLYPRCWSITCFQTRGEVIVIIIVIVITSKLRDDNRWRQIG